MQAGAGHLADGQQAGQVGAAARPVSTPPQV
jgi:hypothetical protein